MSQYNSLTLTVYSSGSTVLDPSFYDKAQDIKFGTFYPGGSCDSASWFIPYDVGSLGQITLGMRVQLWSKNDHRWEGFITAIGVAVHQGISGLAYTALGAWGYLLEGSPKINKPWADTRLDQSVWSPQGVSASIKPDMFTTNNQNMLHVVPKAVTFAAGNTYYGYVYQAPVGETIKKVTVTYSLAAPTGSWAMRLQDVTNASNLWSYAATASGTRTDNAGAGCTTLAFQFYSTAGQTGTADGTVYGEINTVIVYTETTAINPTTIATSLLGYLSGVSANTNLIGSNTLSVVPFVADNIAPAEVLRKAGGYGDASYNPWAFYLGLSTLSTDDKPILIYEQQPAMTATDYVVRIDEGNIVGDIDINEDLTPVRNYITVRYNTVDGRQVVITPNDDATLKDTTSGGLYGYWAEELVLDTTDATLAKNYAKRYLAQWKNPQWIIDSGITLQGYVRDANENKVPVSAIRSGQRIRVDDFIQDLNGNGLTFLITHTDYDDVQQICTLQVGRVNRMDTLLARLTDSIK